MKSACHRACHQWWVMGNSVMHWRCIVIQHTVIFLTNNTVKFMFALPVCFSYTLTLLTVQRIMCDLVLAAGCKWWITGLVRDLLLQGHGGHNNFAVSLLYWCATWAAYCMYVKEPMHKMSSPSDNFFSTNGNKHHTNTYILTQKSENDTCHKTFWCDEHDIGMGNRYKDILPANIHVMSD